VLNGLACECLSFLCRTSCFACGIVDANLLAKFRSGRNLEVRNLMVGEFLSLDGVMEAPENWTGPCQTEETGEFTKAQILASHVMILGRKDKSNYRALIYS
jgi:hypothetical protein